jgi:hypothetical protein
MFAVGSTRQTLSVLQTQSKTLLRRGPVIAGIGEIDSL